MNKHVKYYTIFLILLCVLNFAQCARRACRKKANAKRNSTNVEDVLETAAEDVECQLYEPCEVDNHLPMRDCYYGTKMKGKVINPYETYEKHAQDIFKSACIRCAVCLAVAQSMNETLQDHLNQNYYGQCPALDKNCLCKILEPLCATGFKNYDLRQVNEDILLTVSSSNSKHVSTPFHGSWTEKLRETCQKYLNNMECDLDERLRSGSLNFIEFLCDGYGIFRDCRNIKLKLAEIPGQDSNLCVKCN